MRSRFLVTLTVVSVVLAGCGADEEQGIRLSGWVSSPFESDAMQEIVAEFSAANPETNLAYHPIQANYIEKIQLMLGTGTAPDVFMLDAFWAPSLIGYDTLMPLDEFIERDPEFDIGDFEPVLLDAFRRDGRLYGIPKDYSTVALFVNPEMFRKAGLTEPPRNLDELLDYARTLTIDVDGDGVVDQYGLGISESLEAILPFIWQNNGDLVDPDGRLRVDDQKAIDTVEMLRDLRKEGIAVVPTDVGASWNMEAFGRGRVAMAVSGLWAVSFLDTTFADTPYEVAPLKAGTTDSSIAYVVGYVIPKDSTSPDDAWQLLRYLTDKAGQARWAELDIGLPPRRSVVDSTGALQDPAKRVFIEAAANARTWQLGSDQRLLDELQTAMQAVFLVDEPIDAALGRADERLRRWKQK